jgi:hypothetical protein
LTKSIARYWLPVGINLAIDEDSIRELGKCVSRRNKAFLAFADRVATLSGGSITLMVTFRTSITSVATYKWLLVACWSGFAVAAVCGTLLHLCLAQFYGKRANDIIRNIDETNGGRLFPFLFIAMTIGFVVGVGALTAFAMFNLK